MQPAIAPLFVLVFNRKNEMQNAKHIGFAFLFCDFWKTKNKCL